MSGQLFGGLQSKLEHCKGMLSDTLLEVRGGRARCFGSCMPSDGSLVYEVTFGNSIDIEQAYVISLRRRNCRIVRFRPICWQIRCPVRWKTWRHATSIMLFGTRELGKASLVEKLR